MKNATNDYQGKQWLNVLKNEGGILFEALFLHI